MRATLSLLLLLLMVQSDEAEILETREEPHEDNGISRISALGLALAIAVVAFFTTICFLCIMYHRNHREQKTYKKDLFHEDSVETDISDEECSSDEGDGDDLEAAVIVVPAKDYEKKEKRDCHPKIRRSISLPDLTKPLPTKDTPKHQLLEVDVPPIRGSLTTLASLFASSSISQILQDIDNVHDDHSKYSGSTISIFNDESSCGSIADANILQTTHHIAFEELAWEEFTAQAILEEQQGVDFIAMKAKTVQPLRLEV